MQRRNVYPAASRAGCTVVLQARCSEIADAFGWYAASRALIASRLGIWRLRARGPERPTEYTIRLAPIPNTVTALRNPVSRHDLCTIPRHHNHFSFIYVAGRSSPLMALYLAISVGNTLLSSTRSSALNLR